MEMKSIIYKDFTWNKASCFPIPFRLTSPLYAQTPVVV